MMKDAKKACEALGLTVTSVFVPYEQSRNFVKGTKTSERSLNWRVALLRNGQQIITTDYSAGIAHCPSYKQGARWTMDYDAVIRRETDTGRRSSRHSSFSQGRKIEPDTLDVIYSLLMDAEAIEYGGFEDWAENFSYDTDSRKAEGTYKACMRIALQIRKGLGDDLAPLREAFEDY